MKKCSEYPLATPLTTRAKPEPEPAGYNEDVETSESTEQAYEMIERVLRAGRWDGRALGEEQTMARRRIETFLCWSSITRLGKNGPNCRSKSSTALKRILNMPLVKLWYSRINLSSCAVIPHLQLGLGRLKSR